jgi:hypothetical protein
MDGARSIRRKAIKIKKGIKKIMHASTAKKKGWPHVKRHAPNSAE